MHCQPHAPVATRDPVGRTSVHRPKITAVGLVNLHAYARPNVNDEVSAQMGQFYVAVYTGRDRRDFHRKNNSLTPL